MSPTSQNHRYLTPEEAAEYVSVSRVFIHRQIRAGKLPALRLGDGPRARLRIAVDDLETYIKKHKTAVS